MESRRRLFASLGVRECNLVSSSHATPAAYSDKQVEADGCSQFFTQPPHWATAITPIQPTVKEVLQQPSE